MPTTTAVPSDVTDPRQAGAGKLRIEWADQLMPVLTLIRKRFEQEKPLKGLRIGACLHVTSETANLMRTLQAGGANDEGRDDTRPSPTIRPHFFEPADRMVIRGEHLAAEHALQREFRLGPGSPGSLQFRQRLLQRDAAVDRPDVAKRHSQGHADIRPQRPLQSFDNTTEERMEPISENGETDIDRADAEHIAVALERHTVGAADFAPVVIEDGLVQQIADEIHVSPRRFRAG